MEGVNENKSCPFTVAHFQKEFDAYVRKQEVTKVICLVKMLEVDSSECIRMT